MKPKQWFVFIALGAIWSSSFLWIKIAVQEVGPITLVFYRVLFGLLFGVVMILIQRVSLPRDAKAWTPLLILGISNIAIPFFQVWQPFLMQRFLYFQSFWRISCLRTIR